MRGGIVERYRRDQPRLRRIGDVDDRRPKVLLVRNMPDIGVVAGDGDLAGARQIEMTQAPHIARGGAARTAHGFSWRMILSDLPSPAEAGFAKAGHR
jgi:hypothetical protein